MRLQFDMIAFDYGALGANYTAFQILLIYALTPDIFTDLCF